MIKYLTDKKEIKKEELLNFIYSVDKDFNPRLVGRVKIEEWINKIFNKAEIVVAQKDKTILGLSVFYANNEIEHTAYIAYLAVSTTSRKQGIASQILSNCFDICKDKDMKRIGVHTNNPNAKKLYEKNGFKVSEHNYLNEQNIIRYFLEKQL